VTVPSPESRILDDIEAKRKHLERVQALSPAERTEFHQRLREQERSSNIGVAILIVALLGILTWLLLGMPLPGVDDAVATWGRTS
jgi:hypothetical protein